MPSTLRVTGLAILLALGGTSGALAETLVLTGARVLTMDQARPEASAIAIVDGKIAAIGGDAEMQPFLKGSTVYTLPDALVLPGFQDGHNHLIWSATEQQDIDLTGVTDVEGLTAAIQKGMADLPADAWIRAGGWDISAAGLNPSAATLDTITGDRPAYIAAADGHSAWVNTAALKAAGIDDAKQAPEGGRIERGADGKANGLLRENAKALVSDLLPDYPDSQIEAGLATALAEAHSYGITAIVDPAAKEWMLKGYQRADAAGELSLRVGAAIEIEAPEGASGVERVLALRKAYATPHLEVTSIKLFVDGVIETATAALLEPYLGTDSKGELNFTPEVLSAIAIAGDKAGLQLHAHAIGDAAIRATLDAYEAAQKANGVRDSRHQITHLELIDPADIARFKALGVLANIQALWAYPDSYITDLTEPKLGPERSQWLYPFGALKKAGATLVGASDWSVSSMNPLEAIQTGVTRQDIADPNGRVLTPEQKLDVMDMLAAYTVNGAYAAFDEGQSGTLTVGKRADVVVLDRDITKGASTDIAKAKALLTLVDGKPVFEGEGLAKPTSP